MRALLAAALVITPSVADAASDVVCKAYAKRVEQIVLYLTQDRGVAWAAARRGSSYCVVLDYPPDVPEPPGSEPPLPPPRPAQDASGEPKDPPVVSLPPPNKRDPAAICAAAHLKVVWKTRTRWRCSK